MLILFFVLSAALLLLAVLLLWFVPYLLQQQEERAAKEAKRLRELLADVLGEQEAVTMRQAQLGTSLSYLQDQIEQLATNWPTTVDELMAGPAERSVDTAQPAIQELNERIQGLQRQLEAWSQQRGQRQRQSQRDNESWAYLTGLLGTMQERLGSLEQQRQRAYAQQMLARIPPTTGQEQPVDEGSLEQQLRTISDDLEALQWRIQRSLQPKMLQMGSPAGVVEGVKPANGANGAHAVGTNGTNGANGTYAVGSNGANGANGTHAVGTNGTNGANGMGHHTTSQVVTQRL